jgi:hypothetical protein
MSRRARLKASAEIPLGVTPLSLSFEEFSSLLFSLAHHALAC